MSQLQVVTQGELQSVKVDLLREEWLRWLASIRSRHSVEAYGRAWTNFNQWIEEKGISWGEVDPVLVGEWRNELKEEYSAKTVNLQLTGLRSFYQFLIGSRGLNYPNPLREVKGLPESKRHKRVAFTSKEIRDLLNTCDETPQGIRDRSILSLAAYTGLREIEIVRADLEHLGSMGNHTVLAVWGKGRSEADEKVVLMGPNLEALKAWLLLRRGKAGPLFQSLSNQNKGDRLTTSALRKMFADRCKEAGIVKPDRVKSFHSLRHTMITNAIRHGVDPVKLMNLSRHKSLDVMMGYYHEVNRFEDPPENYINYED